MDIEKLIDRLRTESLYTDKATLEIMDLYMDAAEALADAQQSLGRLWEKVRENDAGRALEFAGRVREHALDLAAEAVQAAAMAQKLIDSAKKG